MTTITLRGLSFSANVEPFSGVSDLLDLGAATLTIVDGNAQNAPFAFGYTSIMPYLEVALTGATQGSILDIHLDGLGVETAHTLSGYFLADVAQIEWMQDGVAVVSTVLSCF